MQPGAKVGDKTYCVVSGVVFTVKEGGSTRELRGKQLYFCCESCANYFMGHSDAVLAARKMSV